MVTTAFPRSQHWTADGFRVTVLVYKSQRYKTCRTCGRRGAIHAVWTDKRADGFDGGPEDFCDEHRPAKGTFPDLVYTRAYETAPFWTVESLLPNAGWTCDGCGQPARFHDRLTCRDCDDLQYRVYVRRAVISLDGERDASGWQHEDHNIVETHECDTCRAPFTAERTAS